MKNTYEKAYYAGATDLNFSKDADLNFNRNNVSKNIIDLSRNYERD